MLGVKGCVQSDLTEESPFNIIGLVAMHLLKPINLTGWKGIEAIRTPCAMMLFTEHKIP